MVQPVTDIKSHIASILSRIREKRPLVHHITNFVVMNDTANLTLQLGALPVMAHAAEEVAEMTRQAEALVLNLGTPTPSRIEAMRIAGQVANERRIPIVLDPVGVGATALRTEAALRLLDELQIAVIRGNAGEIQALRGGTGKVRGVESVEREVDAIALSQTLACEYSTVVAITGERDVVSDGQRALGVENGHHWLTRITGAGGMATATIAAFAAVERDPLMAAVGGLACFGVAAELSIVEAKGPSSLKIALLDQLYHLTGEQVLEKARIVTIRTRN
ncbi:MAG: hydroxyethylthiazole kinase [Chloroflexota bacterium]|nr:hydroxyethylthiazole kinase [Chloroflexota bacterium]